MTDEIKCVQNTDCNVPKALNILMGDREEAKKEREHYREKLDDVYRVTQKLDRVLLGEEDLSNGLIGDVRRMKETFYISEFFHSAWQIVKKPLIVGIAFIVFVFGFFSLGLYAMSKIGILN